MADLNLDAERALFEAYERELWSHSPSPVREYEMEKALRWDRGGYIDSDTQRVWKAWLAARAAVPAQAGNERCQLSWAGKNIYGDKASIDTVKRALHDADTVPELKDRIRFLQGEHSGRVIAWVYPVEPGDVLDWQWPYMFADGSANPAILEALGAFPIAAAHKAQQEKGK